MIVKNYSCEVIDSNGVIIGSRICQIMIWSSAKVAYDMLLTTCSDDKMIVNFRRVK